MAPRIQTHNVNNKLIFHTPSGSKIELRVNSLSLAKDDTGFTMCYLLFDVSFLLFRHIEKFSLFNLNLFTRLSAASCSLHSLSDLQIKVCLKTSLLSRLEKKSSSAHEAANYLLDRCYKENPQNNKGFGETSRQSVSKSIDPLLLTTNWLTLSIRELQDSNQLEHHTLWFYLNRLESSIEEPYFQEEVPENVIQFIQNLESLKLDDFPGDSNIRPADFMEGIFQNLDVILSKGKSQSTKQDNKYSEANLQGKIFNQLVLFFKQENWQFQCQDQSTLRLLFQGKHYIWNCYAQITETQQQFIFYSVCPLSIIEAKRQRIAHFLTRANYGMILGNFELDFDDGEIRYKTSIDVEGDRLTPALVQNLVYTNVMTMDRYLPGIVAVLEQGMTPEEAIRLVEDGTGSEEGQE